ncbi:cytidine deaminase-like protein [Gorgonomyces haynaldii]|nr:cytidine deaminase-like protein [Gorgonomyces haynaldii]
MEKRAKTEPEIGHLLGNSNNRLSPRDMFMIMALWMEQYPTKQQDRKTSQAVRATGCVLVDPRDRIIALDRTGEAHAVVRALMRSAVDPRGCDIYMSRFPCPLCTKMMVQAGIRRIYYFPAKEWEIDYELQRSPMKPKDRSKSFNDPTEIIGASMMSANHSSPSRSSVSEHRNDKMETHYRAVSRLITNNPIALTLYIPRWNEPGPRNDQIPVLELWQLDQTLSETPSLAHRWMNLAAAFESTQWAFSQFVYRYREPPTLLTPGSSLIDTRVMQHAVILAHIAAKRTDDPKVGVGAVLVDEKGDYLSVGWNGFPKRATSTDYPSAGADDTVEEEALKYDYILHAEQNTLLWRARQGVQGSIMVTTKMPCDECSPVISDCGIKTVVTNQQLPKSMDDPARFRGLTYDKVKQLIPNIWVFP